MDTPFRPLSALLAAALLTATLSDGRAQVVQSATVGCSAPVDAEKIAALQARHDKAGIEAVAGPLLTARRCIAFSKGIKVDIDEKKPPLACIRLTGDLSCYWVSATLIDEHPGEKGSAGGGKHGGGHRR